MNKINNEMKMLIGEGIIIFMLLLIIALLVMDFNCCDDELVEEEIIGEVSVEKSEVETIIEDSEIVVDVKGAVINPGIYKLNSDSRISDAIELAGGLKSNASTKYLNLSKKITDEMVIYVYTTTQIKNMDITPQVQEECSCSTSDISSCAGANVIINGESSNSEDTSNNQLNSKVSINKGSKEELMTVSGIGESKALAIIEYRNANNGFKSLEDIMNVSGIGEALYNKIKDSITL